MLLLQSWLTITAGWRSAFARHRSFRRATAQALATLTSVGRRTVSRAIWAQGHQHQDWSADYKLHARSSWEPNSIFQTIIETGSRWCTGRYLRVALDDTRLHKTGRRIKTASYHRDPLSPPFHCNLILGLRFLQCSLLLPLYRSAKASPRGVPVRFVECPITKKPGRKATEQQWAGYRQQVREQNLSRCSIEIIRGLRDSFDQAGQYKILLMVGDNSFCNRTLFGAVIDRVEFVARARKDIKLCRRADQPGLFYARDKFTPEQLRQDNTIEWLKVRVFFGGKYRLLRYKLTGPVYWQTGCRRRPLRLLVLAPTPYRTPGRKRNYYRDPAYLLTTDLNATPKELIQAYVDRWQIEVNHREEKDTLGVGQAQLRSQLSVPRQPAFVVAAYAALLLAGLQAFGCNRTHGYMPLPKWRRTATRPSCLDLVTLLRKEMVENPDLLQPLGFKLDWKPLTLGAAA